MLLLLLDSHRVSIQETLGAVEAVDAGVVTSATAAESGSASEQVDVTVVFSSAIAESGTVAESVSGSYITSASVSEGSTSGSTTVYSNSATSATYPVYSTQSIAQSFTAIGGVITSATLKLAKAGTPTGNATVSIYASEPTLIVPTVRPTGTALATADSVLDVSTLVGTSDKSFTFSGTNSIALVAGVQYMLVLDFPNGNFGTGNYLEWRASSTGGPASENLAYFAGGSWQTGGETDKDMSATVVMSPYATADSVSAQVNFAASITESGTATDTPTVIATFSAAITETGTASDTSFATWITSASVTESNTASETVNSTWTTSASVSELPQAVIDLYNSITGGARSASIMNNGAGETFTGDGNVIHNVTATIVKNGTISGTVRCEIYAAVLDVGTGRYKGSGSVLATSTTFDAASIPTSDTSYDFPFTGADRITLTNGSRYVALIIGTGWTVTGSNNIALTILNTAIADGQNLTTRSPAGSWGAGGIDADVYIKIQSAAGLGETVTAQITQNASITESGTALDVQSAIATFASTITETLTASETPSSVMVASVAQSETVTITDTQSGASTIVVTASESGTIADTPSVVAIYPVAVTESGAATDSVTGTYTTPASIAETGSVSDAVVGTYTTSADRSESLTAAESQSSQTTVTGVQTESGAITDTPTVQADFVASITESQTLTVTETSTAVFEVTRTETGVVADSVSESAVFEVSVEESLNASDNTDAEVLSDVVTITETLAVTDEQDAELIPSPQPDGGFPEPRRGKRRKLRIKGREKPQVRAKLAVKVRYKSVSEAIAVQVKSVSGDGLQGLSEGGGRVRLKASVKRPIKQIQASVKQDLTVTAKVDSAAKVQRPLVTVHVSLSKGTVYSIVSSSMKVQRPQVHAYTQGKQRFWLKSRMDLSVNVRDPELEEFVVMLSALPLGSSGKRPAPGFGGRLSGRPTE